jgi:hypothetical protein
MFKVDAGIPEQFHPLIPPSLVIVLSNVFLQIFKRVKFNISANHAFGPPNNHMSTSGKYGGYFPDVLVSLTKSIRRPAQSLTPIDR